MEIHDLEAERAVLGAALQDGDALKRLASLLIPDDFSAEANAKIWAAMLELRSRGQPADSLTIADELKRRGHLTEVGGPSYIMSLDQSVPLTANAEHYSRIVKDRSRRRRLVQIARDLANRASSLDLEPEEAAGFVQAELARATAGAGRFRTLRQVNDQVYDQLRKIQDGESEPVVATGLAGWDNVVGGLQPSLTVLGGHTGGGKSAVAAAIVQNIARAGLTVGVFSLEDSAEWLSYRYLAKRSDVSNFILRFRKKTDDEWDRIGRSTGDFASYDDRVLVDDTPNLTSRQIIARADDMVINHGARVIVVDHLQEIDHSCHKFDRHELQIRQSLIDLRGWSNRTGIPVLLLAQAREQDDRAKAAAGAPTVWWFMDAPSAISKISRVAAILILDKEANEFRLFFVKHTNGLSSKETRLKFIPRAGMAADLEGAARQLELHRGGDAPPAGDLNWPVQLPESAPIPISRGRRRDFVQEPEEKDDDLEEELPS